jgi:transposase
MGESRRQYDEEFKRNAVELTYRNGKTVSRVAEELGINSSMLVRWRIEQAGYGIRAFPGQGKLMCGTDLEEENRRLKKDLAIAQEERDILKKPWPSSQKHRNDLSVHPGAHGRVPCRDDVPGLESVPDSILPLADRTHKPA